MAAVRFGLPYKGSKSRIAEWVVGVLPASDCLVDLMAGGCAVTHAALLSGKWRRVVANDLGAGPETFLAAVNGEFARFATVSTRDEFNASDDFAVRLLYSFSNDCQSYLWSKELEPVKVAASRMVSAPSVHERRMEYRRFCNALTAYLKGGDAVRKLTGSADGTDKTHGLQRLQGLERLERLERLEGLEGLERLQGLEGGLAVSRLDYRAVPLPDDATIYCDPPYRGTTVDQYGDAGTGFDFQAFDKWLATIGCPVFVSEYAPPAGCVEIAHRERYMTAGTGNKNGRTVERLFVQERYADAFQPHTLVD